MSNFHPLEVVDRGSETQLQVGENLNNQVGRIRGGGGFLALVVINPVCYAHSRPHMYMRMSLMD